MDGRAFINEIVNYYKQSRKLTVDTNDFNIWRGVSHSISSLSEDLFALMIALELNDKGLEFVVDKTFTLRMFDGQTIQFRPDLAVIKGGEIRVIIDLKMDMGYKRNYHETEAFEKEADKFNLLRLGEYESISYAKDKRRIPVTVSLCIKNQIVVISEKNEGKAENRESMINKISALDWINIYYLSGGVHPNTYDVATLKKLTVNQPEFDRLSRDIKGALK
tara:strand:+ start:162 stop:821 length:660 start_codon:yes stop_codon:yes gene_type:complete